MAIQQGIYTVEEFEHIAAAPENAERLLELIDGEIVEKVPTEEHGLIAMNIGAALHAYAVQHKTGRVVMEVRHHVPGDEHNTLIPDISYRAGQTPLVKKGSVPQMPDLAVEIKSPDQALKHRNAKARYYLVHGTQIVWLVLPEQQLIEVYTAEDEFILNETNSLSGGDLLPNFALPIDAVFGDSGSEA